MKTADIASPVERTVSGNSTLHVMVVGQTPPPYHGQSIMIKMLLDGQLPGVELHHVRMAFSDDINQVGRFRLGKVFHLAVVIFSIIYSRFRFGTRVLYYPPAGPNLIPLFRDIVILLSTRWLFARTIFHFHACGVSELIAKLPFPLRWLAKMALTQPSAAIQLCELTASDASFLAARRVFTIPNATHDEAKRLHHVRKHRQRDEPLKLLFVGTVCEGKGVLVLLDAIGEAIRDGVQLRLDIVGSFQPAEFREAVERCIDTNGLSEVVHLWGQQTGDDKWQRFAEADVFCFPSHYQSEGFPCVLLEAMCFSLPVLSTQWRGIPAIVEHGKTGFLTATNDRAVLSRHLKTLAEDPELCQRLGNAGREKFCDQFTVEKHINRLRNAFLELSND